MNKIKAAIIEDEVPAARLLHEMIQSLRPDWEVMILPGTIEESVFAFIFFYVQLFFHGYIV